MRTIKNLTIAAALLISSSVFAQGAEQEKMSLVENAEIKTVQLNSVVNLTDEQTPQIKNAYYGVLKQEMAMNQRYANSNMEVDQEQIDMSTRQSLSKELSKILTPEQYNAWKLDLKKN